MDRVGKGVNVIMEKPSKEWQLLRRATLERAKKNTVQALSPIYSAFFLASFIYLACFSLLFFGGAPTQFTWLLGSFVIAAAISGLILPVLTGAALTLYFTHKKLEYLVNE